MTFCPPGERRIQTVEPSESTSAVSPAMEVGVAEGVGVWVGVAEGVGVALAVAVGEMVVETGGGVADAVGDVTV